MELFKATQNIEINRPLTTISRSKYSTMQLKILLIKNQVHLKIEDHCLHKEIARKMINFPKLIVRERFTSNGHFMFKIMMLQKRLNN